MDWCIDYLDYAVMCYSCFDNTSSRDTIRNMPNDQELCPRLHRALLKKTNEYIENHDNLQPQLLEFQQCEWNKIGMMLLDMCCAGKDAFV